MVVDVPINHPLVRHLWSLPDDSSPEERVAATLRAYSEDTGVQLGNSPTPAELTAVRVWLITADRSMPLNEHGHSVSLLWKRRRFSQPLVHEDAARKAGWLQHAPCLTCNDDASRTPISVSFGIRTRPFSAQSLKPDQLRRLKQQITDRMRARPFASQEDWHDSILCVRVVAVVARTDHTKDVDNMVKGLLDALQGSAWANDSRIGHLSVDRFRHAGDDGFYQVSMRPVLDGLADVIDPIVSVGWLGQDEILW